MDRDAETMIIADLIGARPDDGLLGEEGGERPGTSGVRWVVDPLDGTVNYLHRLPMWGVSIAAEVDGHGVVGVVHVPEFAESYVAVRGAGAWLVRDGVGERLTGSDCTVLSAAIVATGFGYAAERRRRQAEVVTGLITQVSDVRRMGAAVVDFCWLARGRVDAYYEAGLNPVGHGRGRPHRGRGRASSCPGFATTTLTSSSSPRRRPSPPTCARHSGELRADEV